MLNSRFERVAVGAGVALSAGVAKEVYDEIEYGGASYKDLAFDVAGAAVGVVAAWLIDLAVDDRNPEVAPPQAGLLSIRF
jgi:putative lipoprotein